MNVTMVLDEKQLESSKSFSVTVYSAKNNTEVKEDFNVEPNGQQEYLVKVILNSNEGKKAKSGYHFQKVNYS